MCDSRFIGPLMRRAHEKKMQRAELKVFHTAAEGLSNKEIAARLFVSEATVKMHVQRMRKLDACSRTQAVSRSRDSLNLAVT